MGTIPTVTFQILGPNEGAAEGTSKGLWFKIRSDPPPPEDLVVAVKVRAGNGAVRNAGVVMVLKQESHSADLFYKTVDGTLDVWLEIEPFDVLSQLTFPVVTNEGYVIAEGHAFLEYTVGSLAKIVPYQWNGADKCLWTDEDG